MFQRLIKHRGYILFLLLISILISSYLFLMRVNESLYRLPLQDLPTSGTCKELTMLLRTRRPVGLVSIPGSGSTWLRHLLQQSTGFITGSLHGNLHMCLNGFPGEYIVDGSVLIVKTHYFVKKTLSKVMIDSVILLIRNPKESMLAMYHMQYVTSIFKSTLYKHRTKLKNLETIRTAVAPPSVFKKLSREWPTLVTNYLKEWTAFYTDWLTSYRGTIHVVFYEDLVNNTRNELKAMLNFLNVTVSEVDVSCAITRQNDLDFIYRRIEKYKYFDPFTNDMYKEIELAKNTVYGLIKY